MVETRKRKNAETSSGGCLVRWALLLVLLLLAVVAFLAVSMALVLTRVETAPATQMAPAVQPLTTPTLVAREGHIVRDVQRLALIQSARFNIEKVIAAESGQADPFPFLTGDRLLFVAVGYVTAGADLAQLGEADILVGDGERVLVIMPPARLIDCFLDEHESFVYTRESGILAAGFDLESHARRAALVEIREAALEAGILSLAQDQAQNVVRALILGLGFADVTFQTRPDAPVPLTSETCYSVPPDS